MGLCVAVGRDRRGVSSPTYSAGPTPPVASGRHCRWWDRLLSVGQVAVTVEQVGLGD